MNCIITILPSAGAIFVPYSDFDLYFFILIKRDTTILKSKISFLYHYSYIYLHFQTALQQVIRQIRVLIYNFTYCMM